VADEDYEDMTKAELVELLNEASEKIAASNASRAAVEDTTTQGMD